MFICMPKNHGFLFKRLQNLISAIFQNLFKVNISPELMCMWNVYFTFANAGVYNPNLTAQSKEQICDWKKNWIEKFE